MSPTSASTKQLRLFACLYKQLSGTKTAATFSAGTLLKMHYDRFHVVQIQCYLLTVVNRRRRNRPAAVRKLDVIRYQ